MVNKNAGVLDEDKKPVLPNPLDERDNPELPDCQTLNRETRIQIFMALVGEIGRLIPKAFRKLIEFGG